MPSRSYTQPLWNATITTAGVTEGPFVPPGDVWVVRDVTLVPPAGTLGLFLGHAFVREVVANSVLWGVGNSDAVASQVYHSELRQALIEGNALVFDCYTGGWTVAVTGYAFTAQ